MEFITGKSGGTKLVYEGYIYVKTKLLADGKTATYECEQRRKKGLCSAKIKILDGEVIGKLHEHTHAADRARVEAIKVHHILKRCALETQQPASQIIEETIASISEDTVSKLPKLSSISRSIRRHRRVLEAPIPIPDNLADLELPPQYKETLYGSNFLLYDNNDRTCRILIFGTDRALSVLETTDHWFCDSTFKIIPELFYKVCTISALNENGVIPCIYGLLADQSEGTYHKFFQAILTLKPMLNPRQIMTDFQQNAVNALRILLPNTVLRGCFYHLSSAVYRKVQDEGLTNYYANDNQFSIHTRMIIALAFVPLDHVVRAFEDLQEVISPTMQPVCNYFEDNYIGTIRGRAPNQYRQQPPFPTEFWNMYNRVNLDLHKIIDHIEGWHRSFQVKVGARHTNIWKFLNVFHKEEDKNNVKIQQTLAGEQNTKTEKTTQTTVRIKNLVNNYQSQDLVISYLQSIAVNITL